LEVSVGIKSRKKAIYFDSEMQKESPQAVTSINLNEGYSDESDEDGDLEKLKTTLQKEYILFIIKNLDGKYEYLMIQLFRLERPLKPEDEHLVPKDEQIYNEFIGGLLHTFQHFQINGKPISALNKTQKGDTEFYSNEFFSCIFEAFIINRHLFKEEINKQGKKSYNVTFDFLKRKWKCTFHKNEEVDTWYLTTLYSV
jgi:hypothetical protein